MFLVLLAKTVSSAVRLVQMEPDAMTNRRCANANLDGLVLFAMNHAHRGHMGTDVTAFVPAKTVEPATT